MSAVGPDGLAFVLELEMAKGRGGGTSWICTF